MKEIPTIRKYTGFFGGKGKPSPADQARIAHEAEETKRVDALPRIFVYGFDKVGFHMPVHPKSTEYAVVEFIPYADNSRRLEEADGVIICQSIFERFETYQPDYSFSKYTSHKVDVDLLLERERQLRNLEKKGGWVCFLLETFIRDSYYSGHSYVECKDTDLCKKIMNRYDIRRSDHRADAHAEATRDEFRPYIEKYGVVCNDLTPGERAKECVTLARAGGYTVGLESHTQFFFLPVHSTNKTEKVIEDITELVSDAIAKYKMKRPTSLPQWAKKFEFSSEKSLQERLESIAKEQDKIIKEIEEWDSYKGLLVLQSDALTSCVENVLKKYFGLNVEHLEKYVEDLKILDENGQISHFIEATGTTKGITREKVAQAGSFSERNELPDSRPTALIYNNQLSIEDIAERSETTVSEDQIELAERLNVLIIRTIDLLFFMKHLAGKSVTERKEEILKLLASGGGWLHASDKEYKLVQPLKKKQTVPVGV